MVFFRFLIVAQQWKNLVFLSPSFRYMVLDLCLHIRSSLSMREFISFCKTSRRVAQPPWSAILSCWAKSLLLFSSSFQIEPKWSQLHLVSSLPHDSIFLINCVFLDLPTLDSHTPSTTSPHPLFANHISSNLNNFFLRWKSNSANSIQKMICCNYLKWFFIGKCLDHIIVAFR